MKTLLTFALNQIKKLKYFFLWFHSRKYKYYDVLNILAIYLDYVNISKISSDPSSAYCNVIFSDGSRLEFGNNNSSSSDSRWKTWMCRGTMKFSNGKILEWRDKSPSYETLYKYKKLILKNERIVKNERKQMEKIKYDDCIPVKYMRKQKLKSIKKK